MSLFSHASLWASARGLSHIIDKPSGDIRMTCPKCGGVVHVHQAKGWFFCLGEKRCRVSGQSFTELEDVFDGQR